MKCSGIRCLSCLIVLKVGGKCCALVLSVTKMPSCSVIGLSWRMPNVSKVCWFERRKTSSSESVAVSKSGGCGDRLVQIENVSGVIEINSLFVRCVEKVKLRSPATIKLL